ncbi:MAG: TPM domain-containing protein [Phycisphaeraceae bacterium]
MRRSTHPERFLTAAESQRMAEAIARVERNTSAELNLLIVRHCWGKLHEKARRLFYKHGLDRTAERNAVMILLVTSNREFLIFGDQGIHQHVGPNFWLDVRDAMANEFRAGRVIEGLETGIGRIGEKLAAHFPAKANNPNELSDEVANDR